MSKQQRDWLVLFSAIMVISGFILSKSHGCTGWFLIVFGMVYLSVLSSFGQKWITKNPHLLQWGMIGGVIVFVLLVIRII